MAWETATWGWFDGEEPFPEGAGSFYDEMKEAASGAKPISEGISCLEIGG